MAPIDGSLAKDHILSVLVNDDGEILTEASTRQTRRGKGDNDECMTEVV